MSGPVRWVASAVVVVDVCLELVSGQYMSLMAVLQAVIGLILWMQELSAVIISWDRLERGVQRAADRRGGPMPCVRKKLVSAWSASGYKADERP